MPNIAFGRPTRSGSLEGFDEFMGSWLIPRKRLKQALSDSKGLMTITIFSLKLAYG
jgi:hypothetical protein